MNIPLLFQQINTIKYSHKLVIFPSLSNASFHPIIFILFYSFILNNIINNQIIIFQPFLSFACLTLLFLHSLKLTPTFYHYTITVYSSFKFYLITIDFFILIPLTFLFISGSTFYSNHLYQYFYF